VFLGIQICHIQCVVWFRVWFEKRVKSTFVLKVNTPHTPTNTRQHLAKTLTLPTCGQGVGKLANACQHLAHTLPTPCQQCWQGVGKLATIVGKVLARCWFGVGDILFDILLFCGGGAHIPSPPQFPNMGVRSTGHTELIS
jgi:hypothetical protein